MDPLAMTSSVARFRMEELEEKRGSAAEEKSRVEGEARIMESELLGPDESDCVLFLPTHKRTEHQRKADKCTR